MSGREHSRRRVPINARGEVGVWAMGGALIVAVLMIVGLIGLILFEGGRAFWPRPIELIPGTGATAVLGVPLEEQDGRTRYQLANRDLRAETARWVDVPASPFDRPADAAYVERDEWGAFLGLVEGVEVDGERVASSDDAGWDSELASALADARARHAALERIDRAELPSVKSKLRRLEWRRRGVVSREQADPVGRGLVWPLWIAAVLVGLGGIGGFVHLAINAGRSKARVGLAWALLGVVVFAGMLAVFEPPWSGKGLSPERVASETADIEAQSAALHEREAAILTRRDALEREDARHRLIVRQAGDGAIAPTSQSLPDEPMRVSQARRVIWPNRLGFADKLGVYLSRWWSYLTTEPRSNGSEGGVWPVIVGTVTLTLLLTVGVVPLGVVAAVYMREYARQGVLTSLIRIAINNLAGVPSIVYGMFGLGFFCYAMGGWIDSGPETPAAPGTWWGVLAAGLAMMAAAGFLTALSASVPGRVPTRLQRLARVAAWVAWVGCLAMAAWLVAFTPLFDGFFEHKLPEQATFGRRGVLWASLTLALLTLPVVIVATEEAISAVPASMREGSLAAGGTRWQTIRKIVLPHAMPGVLTGAILAMARGAGEVAPLMLVGAVNYSPALPVSADPPFLHGDRTFMHLGFHIYSVAFQSPDAEAAMPLVWTATLLLIAIVLMLKLGVIWLRARLASNNRTGGV